MTTNPRLLIVAPAFPPHPSPATHRSRFLARYAGAFGWDVEVLAVDPSYYVEDPDDDLFRLLPSDLQVTYSPAWRTSWTRRLGVSDLGMRAYYPMRKVLRRVCQERRPDLLFISGAPFHTFLLGADVRREFGVPYVLDYTDPWIDPERPEHRNPRTKVYWARKLAGLLEPSAVRNSSHIFAVSDATHDGVRARNPDIPAERFSAVPIGFDASDFESVRTDLRGISHWNASDGRFHFAYVGAVSRTMRPAVRAWCAALRVVLQRTPDLQDRILVHFIGTSYDPRASSGPVLSIAEAEGVADVVNEHPRRIPYVDALKVLVSADAILCFGSLDRHYQASKIFNCILAGRPVLGIYNEESDVCEILDATPQAHLVKFGDDGPTPHTIESISDAVSIMMQGAGRVTPAISASSVAPYSAQQMAARMLAVCDRIVGRSAATSEAPEYQHA